MRFRPLLQLHNGERLQGSEPLFPLALSSARPPDAAGDCGGPAGEDVSVAANDMENAIAAIAAERRRVIATSCARSMSAPSLARTGSSCGAHEMSSMFALLGPVSPPILALEPRPFSP